MNGNEDSEICSFLTLPEELRAHILTYLPQPDILSLRLVCIQLNHDIINYYDFKVKQLDETSSVCQNILQLRIKSLEIHNLQETSVELPNGSTIFEYLHLIKQLRIVCRLDRIVSPTNLNSLMTLCAKHLQMLSLDLTSSVYSYQFPQNTVHNFMHLRELEIIFRSNDYDRWNGYDDPDSLIEQLENSEMPNLKSLKVKSYQPGYRLKVKRHIVLRLLKIVATHWKSLETLRLELATKIRLNSEFSVPLPIPLDELDSLKELQLKEICINLEPQDFATKEFWEELVCNQKALEILEICGTPPLSPLSITSVRNIVFNNSATLTKIEIQTLTIQINEIPFDLSVFQNCVNLKTLLLSRNTNVQRLFPQVPDISNFNLLPENITNLSLQNFTILSSEIISFSNLARFKKLQKLELLNCGDILLVGVTGTVLETILTMNGSSLTELKISGFNTQNFEESKKLESILTTFSGHKFLKTLSLRRQSVADPWPQHSEFR